MALVLHSDVNDPGLTALTAKTGALQIQLERLRSKTASIRTKYESKCAAALTGAVKELLLLSETVLDADKELIYWYEHGKVLRVVLRPFGVNKKATAIVQRRTSKLMTKAARVETKFSAVSTVCKKSITEVQTLNRRVNEFNRKGIGGALTQSNNLTANFDVSTKELQLKICEKEVERDRISSDIDAKEEAIERAKDSRVRTREAQGRAAGTGAAGVAVAIGIIGFTIFCPPAGALGAIAAGAGGAAAIGAGGLGIGAAIALDGEADQLLALQNELDSQLTSLQSEIADLQSQLPPLEAQKKRYDATTASIAGMRDECTTMRAAATKLSGRLLDDRRRLTSARLRVDKIISDLRALEYAKTRRMITGRLVEVLQELGAVGGDSGSSKAQSKLRLLRSCTDANLRAMKRATPKVTRILEAAAPST